MLVLELNSSPIEFMFSERDKKLRLLRYKLSSELVRQVCKINLFWELKELSKIISP
jgi:hypothetical protein